MIYPVEPVADSGYWRLDITYDSSLDKCEDRDTRDTCYSVVPCQPEEACEGDNTCAKGYTGDRCALCCDVANRGTVDDTPGCWESDGTTAIEVMRG